MQPWISSVHWKKSGPILTTIFFFFYFKVEDEGEIVIKWSVQTENLATQQKQSQKKSSIRQSLKPSVAF